MRVFKPTYKSRAAEPRSTRAWYVELLVAGRTRRVPAFADKGASLEFGRKLERLGELRESGQLMPAELLRWIAQL